jgi:SinI restriction endonuclease
MPFDKTSAALAKDIMKELDPSLAVRFGTLIEFLVDNPDAASVLRGAKGLAKGSKDHLRLHAENFIASRKPRAPKPPATVPDEMVSFIIHKYFDVPESELERAVELHNLAMGAENLVGDILERYIASEVEDDGWVWCSGSMVKAIDFIHRKNTGEWVALQVKNRDNSENSSSSAIRKGTTIEKWFRTFSKKKGDNWSNFPKSINVTLSELGFRMFVDRYLQDIKNGK